ncbi:diol dehydratase small subunit [Hyphomicrobium sp.]|jgi:propanediol dehydratase small subunit|uniref:diol dehydratase small subunit n=1 Tax=Hyphomicrobium sp. TaxID=82 RepID=UPI002B75E855|nr:diol dehydratase small subunit [Hyphomicrobium sp.]HVZ04439.1 diol dehydratase small subunit [Hyphomicrobium sp.]
MSKDHLSAADYPLAEKRPDVVRTKAGKSIEDITLDGVLSGQITLEDLRITSTALRQQAEIARAAGRPTLAQNFERGAELVDVPQDVIMRTYELLRPGRANSKTELLTAAKELREAYGAAAIASFIEEAAEVYERRALFKRRY